MGLSADQGQMAEQVLEPLIVPLQGTVICVPTSRGDAAGWRIEALWAACADSRFSYGAPLCVPSREANRVTTESLAAMEWSLKTQLHRSQNTLPPLARGGRGGRVARLSAVIADKPRRRT